MQMQMRDRPDSCSNLRHRNGMPACTAAQVLGRRLRQARVHSLAAFPQKARQSSTAGRPRIAALLTSDRTPDETVTVNGFVQSVRKQKRVAFAALGDGTSLEPLQLVLTPEQAEG